MGRQLITSVPEKATGPKKSRFFYGWVIIAVGFLVFSLGYGTRYSFSVTFPSLLEQFDWSRDAAAAILSLHLLAYGITAPLAGTLVDRLGARKTIGLGTFLFVLGLALSSLGNSLWHFSLSFGLLAGVGLSLMGAVPFTRVIANWFVRRRGLAFSFLFFGSGIGFLLYPLVAFLIQRIGWRGAFIVEAALVAAIVLPGVILLIRQRPEEKGLLPDGGKEIVTGPEAKVDYSDAVADKAWATTDWTLPKAMKTARFWLLCFSAFSVWGITEHVLVAHHVAFAEDIGYTKLYASSVLALFGVSMAMGSLAGSISDRIGREITFSVGTVIGVSGIIMLILMQDTSQTWMLYSYSILFGVGFGITSPTIAAAATDMFQGRRAGAVIGFIWFTFAVGGTIGPWLGGAIFEAGGSYTPAFITAAAMFVIACISLWLAAPRHIRPTAGKAKAILD